MKYQAKSKAYIIENGWRIIEVQIINESDDFYLVRFPSGGGIRVNGKRLYDTIEEAEKVVEERQNRISTKIEHPRPARKDSTFHSPHFYGWI
ncbi:hypothetical protein UYO_2810 [Lachnospiraceae bacterium JC7]|nr:hypothetical protein UYO_2810 [Lachnospiraceae bacterium JC7]